MYEGYDPDMIEQQGLPSVGNPGGWDLQGNRGAVGAGQAIVPQLAPADAGPGPVFAAVAVALGFVALRLWVELAPDGEG